MATDKEGRNYFVDHVNKTTTYEDPRKWTLPGGGPPEPEEAPPEPRTVNLVRDSELGFGFVAGSEKPVIVRFVTSGGPSVDKLMPGDQILQINGEDVKLAPRDHVIQLVRNCKEEVSLVVCQPPLDNSSTRKSALLSAAKRAKLKSNPNRVRFAESVDINGSPLHNGLNHSQMTSHDSVMPLMPNVLKVFLENGQTKSFKYDGSTTVSDVIDSLQAKLGLKSTIHFALVVEHIKSLRRNKLTILDPKERLSVIASRPGAHNLRCLFRVTFVPNDSYSLLREDPVAFEYLFVQCCNDVVQERFAPELKYDIALRLAALQIHQHVIGNNGNNAKVTVKAVEKECGLEKFVPASLAESMKRKELRKLLTHFLKLNSNLTSSSSTDNNSTSSVSKQLTALQAKLHYLKIISDLPSYGAKCFSTNISDSNIETVILISPKFGVSQINSLRNSVPLNLCDIEEASSVLVSKEDEISQKIEIVLKDPEKENIVLSLEDRDSSELILVLAGYYRLLTDRELDVVQQQTAFTEELQAPSFCSKHLVTSAGWNYPGGVNPNQQMLGDPPNEFMVDLGAHPPYHPPPEGFSMRENTNGNSAIPFSSDSGSDADSSMTSQLANNDVDKNRNNLALEDNANYNSPSHLSTFTGNSFNNNNQNGTIPNGILKKPPKAPPNSATSTPKRTIQLEHMEARNDAVIRRVAEMKALVSDAESYLQNPHHNHDTGSLTGSNSTTGSGDTGSGSSGHGTDSDSIVSANRSELSDASSSTSYGKIRHSDSLTALQDREEDERVVLHEAVNRSLNISGHQGSYPDQQAESRLKPNFQSRLKQSDSSFGLHSPDNFPGGLSSNENEDLRKKLKNTKRHFKDGHLIADSDLIDLTMIPPPMTPDEDGVYRVFPGTASAVSTPPTPFADRQSLEAELKALEVDHETYQSNWGINRSASNQDLKSPSSEMAALHQLRDLDSFIANTAVPPPPTNLSANSTLQKDYDLKAFIIPPPPPPSTGNNPPPTPSHNTMEHGRGQDREVQEVRVPNEVMRNDRDKISPKIASIQQKLMSPDKEELTSFRNFQDTLSRKRSDHSSSPSPRPHLSHSVENSPVRGILRRQNSNPAVPNNSSNVPPPPPPRSVVSRSLLLSNNKSVPNYQFGNSPLDKTGFKLPLNKKMDSDESKSPGSPSNNTNKMSLTSSSDSLSSNASVNTVKSVSPVGDYPPLAETGDDDAVSNSSEDPPSLPPRLSPIKNFKKEDQEKNVVPALPSRSPGTSGNYQRNLPQVPEKKVSSQKAVLKIKENGVTYPIASASSETDQLKKPALPQKMIISNHQDPNKLLSGGRKLPMPPPPPPAKPKAAKDSLPNGTSDGKPPEIPLRKNVIIPNGFVTPGKINGMATNPPEIYSNSEFDPDDSSLEGTSVDEDETSSQNDSNILVKQASRVILFRKAEEVIANVVDKIEEAHDICSDVSRGERTVQRYEKVKEVLTNEARQFVTASKLFVKSATESEGQMMECLNHCVKLMDRIGNVTTDLAESTTTVTQTRILINRIKDVADSYLQTVKAAGKAMGKGMNDPTMGVLMKKATTLAGVLTTLMRSLRVFN